jgi:hypothetical protein
MTVAGITLVSGQGIWRGLVASFLFSACPVKDFLKRFMLLVVWYLVRRNACFWSMTTRQMRKLSKPA